MATVIEAPHHPSTVDLNHGLSLFLGGGITNCRDWQTEVIDKLRDDNLIIFNPRRATFDLEDSSLSEEQIKWENHYLLNSEIIVFWFASETLCPITLYELGFQLGARYMMEKKVLGPRIIVGIDPEYKRKFDVEIQTALVDNSIPIVYNLDMVVSEVRNILYH